MNLTNFQAYVKQDFKRTDKDTEITQAYNDSILQVALRMPNAVYKYQSYVPLVAAQEDYPFPSTIMHLIHPVRYNEGATANDEGWPLILISKQEYDQLYPNPNRVGPTDLSTPMHYTIYSGSILIGPMVSSVEVTAGAQIEIDWTTIPTDLITGTSVPLLPDYWREVLKAMVLHRLYRMVELYQESDWWRGMFEDPYGNPIGTYKRLLDIERSKESTSILKIRPNNL
jgi:hypothetical protein